MSHLRTMRGRLTLALTLSMAALITGVVFTVLAASTIGWQETSTGLPTTNIVRDTEFADVNHDGQPDLIAVGNIGVAVYQGNGLGVWASGVLSFGLPASGGYGHVAVGDLDNDGNADIVASAGNGVGVKGWYGDGAGNWTAIASGLPTGTSEGVALGDVNQDGRPDIIVAGGAPIFTGIHVYLNQGSNFSETTALTTTGTYNDIAAAYVDNDGYIDVIAAADSTGLKFWRGNFNSAWIYASTGLSTTNNWRGVTFGDVDLDGKLELVAARSNIASSTGGGLFVYDYDLLGMWSLSPNQLPVTNSYFKLVLADLNIDGRLDLTAGGGSTFLSQGIFQWLGSINGFVPTTSPTTTASWERPGVGDFDRDGLLDVGAGAYNGGGARAWRSTGVRDPIGAWTLIASPQITDSPRALAAADFNRDGDTDVIFNRAGGNGLNMYLGDGGNAWTYCPAFNFFGGAYTGTYESVIAAPFDRNSQYPQIVAGRDDGGGIQYFGNVTNNCGYFFTFQVTTTGSYRGLSAADIDDDSYWQLVAAPYHLLNQGLRVFENGANGWQLQSIPIATGTYCDTALGDFNHDGKQDIAAAECTPNNGGGLNVFEYWSRGWISHNLTGPGMFFAVAAGDLNNDGKDDLVAAKNGGEQGLYVWTGDGAFNFTPWPSPDTLGEYFDLDLGDVNHDGWLDILAARDGAGVMVWLGDGAGGWTASNTNLPTTGAFFKSLFSHVDHDGNLDIVSTGLNQGVKIWTAAEAAPPTINNIQPTTWITLTQSPAVTANVLDSISGISTTSGLYRFSINGGGSWSAFAPATISGSDGSTATQVLTAASVPFGQDSGTQNIVELRASDMVGNVGVAQAVVKIDTTPPTAPSSLTSSDHTVNVWSNDDTISIDWSGATDATSGVFGYAVLFDQNAATLPPPVVNAGGTSFNSTALADGATWYAHVRTHDLAGNWSTTAAHLGPFRIDTTPPTNPANVSSSSHTLGVWSNDPSITMNWSGASDAGSGVSGYSYVFDTAAGTLPDTVVDTFGATATSASLPSGSNKYFHIRTRDAAGNWSASGVNRGAYFVDVTTPSSSVNSPASSSSTSFTVFWSGSDAHSGIDNYDVQYRDKTTNSAWTTWKSATSLTSSTFNGTGGHIYEFRSRARDNVGNLEAYPGVADLTTEVRTIDVYVRNPGVEVNQAVQDLNNSVLLIANKRTFVRCYVQSDAGTINNVNARLRVYRGATYWGILSPSNSGAQINIRTSPDRAQLD
ncbi:MAG: VCBS repeat-containing protein, partial [Chloroflexi bacterium]|nr:VCBS repeat-containing protein [Chloroflexota bacterium]